MINEWRRKYARISCFLPSLIRSPVLLQFKNGEKPSDGWGVIHDISLGGIKIETRTELEKGQTIFISFSLSDNFKFANTKGIVTRTVKDGIYYTYGIKFESVVDQEHLKNAIEEILYLKPEKTEESK